MTIRTFPAFGCSSLLAAIILSLATPDHAQADAMKLQALLVWATNDKSSPDPSHKPVEPAVRERLKELPLKWSHYFEVNRKTVEVSADAKKKVGLSEKCDIEVKNLGDSKIEVALFGKGERVVKRTQALPKGEILVVGGNAPNETAWLVVIKRIQ